MCVNFDPGAHVIFASGFAFETWCDMRLRGHRDEIVPYWRIQHQEQDLGEMKTLEKG